MVTLYTCNIISIISLFDRNVLIAISKVTDRIQRLITVFTSWKYIQHVICKVVTLVLIKCIRSIQQTYLTLHNLNNRAALAKVHTKTLKSGRSATRRALPLAVQIYRLVFWSGCDYVLPYPIRFRAKAEKLYTVTEIPST